MKTKNKILRVLLINYYMMLIYKKRKYRNRKCWVKQFLKVRNILGAFKQLFLYFKQHDKDEFQNLTRLTVRQFDILHNLVKKSSQSIVLFESLLVQNLS